MCEFEVLLIFSMEIKILLFAFLLMEETTKHACELWIYTPNYIHYFIANRPFNIGVRK